MKTLALDIGLKRIGVALCVNKSIAMPLEAIIRKNRNQAANEVKKYIKEYGVNTLVVGVPLGGSSENEMRKRIEHFISLLDFDKEVFFVDESFSSKNAQELGMVNLKKKDGKLDSLAAYLFLKDFYGLA
ncbi:TPA: Holliday junction resolvase RuvX [Campylobacter lari subsp. concheus]|uniref:Holliday junction resolvase RuvX n=1 Tax=Campylobacter TaxID=194 RepID=UPI000B3FA875|nr:MULTISPECIES: Holliday junction resolvase RuvX [Campylobacter]EAJ6150086.1 Holliday junction resolvase RuvX [Campylobacter lari]EHZ4884582.1 Holliday junction resolvase RuvX [Campylobacter lari]MBT0815086.1 Holliday junction resolvase RuvX [Campylobacter lari]MBT0828237.1 Holliday junction resolvase RuvX [Campylobacter lari]MCV3551234.1 Holliday junction resolvase RuvX [Campylobacter sp. CNRCH_2013_0855]